MLHQLSKAPEQNDSLALKEKEEGPLSLQGKSNSIHKVGPYGLTGSLDLGTACSAHWMFTQAQVYGHSHAWSILCAVCVVRNFQSWSNCLFHWKVGEVCSGDINMVTTR